MNISWQPSGNVFEQITHMIEEGRFEEAQSVSLQIQAAQQIRIANALEALAECIGTPPKSYGDYKYLHIMAVD